MTDTSRDHPAYLRLGRDALASRARRAVAALADCRACPRDCGVNRLDDRWAACKTGRYAVVSSAFPHFGEEDCLRGWNGSGKVTESAYPEINRKLTSAEFCEAQRMARDLGLRRLDVRVPHPRLRRRMMLVEA